MSATLYKTILPMEGFMRFAFENAGREESTAPPLEDMRPGVLAKALALSPQDVESPPPVQECTGRTTYPIRRVQKMKKSQIAAIAAVLNIHPEPSVVRCAPPTVKGLLKALPKSSERLETLNRVVACDPTWTAKRHVHRAKVVARLVELGVYDEDVRDTLIKYYCCRTCGGTQMIGSIACTCVDPITEMPKENKDNKPWSIPTAPEGVSQPKKLTFNAVVTLHPAGWVLACAGVDSDPVPTLAGALKGAQLAKAKNVTIVVPADRVRWAYDICARLKKEGAITFRYDIRRASTQPKAAVNASTPEPALAL